MGRSRARLSVQEVPKVLCFWATFIRESFTLCRLAPLVDLWPGTRSESVEGLEHLPAAGSFILALNHFGGGSTLGVLSATIKAVSRARPDSLESLLIVQGVRGRTSGRGLLRRLVWYILARWKGHLIALPLGNESPSLTALREWRDRARQQPSLVFPEGRARLRFGTVRPGAGRWLASLEVPVLPVAVWCTKEGWHVRVGPIIEWSHRQELLDWQLGLNIATLLPEDLSSLWQEPLARWKGAYDAAVDDPSPAQLTTFRPGRR